MHLGCGGETDDRLHLEQQEVVMEPLGSRPRYRANMSGDTPHLGEQNVFTTVAEDADHVADRQEAQLAEPSCWRIGGSVVIRFMFASRYRP